VNTSAGITIPPHLLLAFEANQGQKNASAQFSMRSAGHDLYLTPTEMVVSFDGPAVAPPRDPHADHDAPDSRQQWVVRMALVGASASGHLTGLGPLPQVAHYLIGNNPSQWHTNIPIYGEVSYPCPTAGN
jgi:hypothetical protein